MGLRETLLLGLYLGAAAAANDSDADVLAAC